MQTVVTTHDQKRERNGKCLKKKNLKKFSKKYPLLGDLGMHGDLLKIDSIATKLSLSQNICCITKT